MKDFAAVATQYAKDVVHGRVDACRWAVLACKRHLRDLAKDAAGWKYTWNPALATREGKPYRPADKICYFTELMPHVKGDWAARGESILLEPWQVLFLSSLFGWIEVGSGEKITVEGEERWSNTTRRFREGDLYVSKKNAKSTLAAIIGDFCLTADGEFGAEVYAGATSEYQAMKVFEPARLMAKARPEFCKHFGVDPRVSNINVPSTNSKFEPLIGNPGDGGNASCVIIDEYHEHQTNALFETMKSGMLVRRQPMLLVISTAGESVEGPCFDHWQELQAILEGTVEDERRFGIIYAPDKEDEWTSEIAIVKANPNLGVSIDAEKLLDEQREAVRNPRKQPNFKTKCLNIWVQAAEPWLDMDEWRRCADPSLIEKDFADDGCHAGLDLSSTTDITSCCRVYRRIVEGKTHFYAFWTHYLPEAAIESEENRHYHGWREKGYLVQTEGNMIDQGKIEADLVALQAVTHVQEADIDAWGSPGIAANLAKKGMEVVRIPQNTQHLSAPMKFIDGLVKDRRLHHPDDPVASWAVGNVTCKPDRNDNWFPRRQGRRKKIDPAVALLNAMSRAMIGEELDAVFEAWMKVGAA